MCDVGRWKSIPFDIMKVANGDLDFAPVSPNRRRKKSIAGFHTAMQQEAQITLAGAVQGKARRKCAGCLIVRSAWHLTLTSMRAQPADGDLGSSFAEHVQYSMWQTRRNPNLPSDSGGLHMISSICLQYSCMKFTQAPAAHLQLLAGI